VTQTGFWQRTPAETYPRAPLLNPRLAATTGEHAAVHALRIEAGSFFIQRLEADGERLAAFPPWPHPAPSLPPVGTLANVPPWWAAVENASFPAGIYADGPLLYVLTRLAETGGPVWELHAVDPVGETLLHRVRLPTRAVHIALVPGPAHWALIENSRHIVDEHRQPKRMLLLDAEVIRTGGELSCG